MITFQVDDMTCGHCAATITKALAAADKDAKLAIDVQKRLIAIDSSSLDANRLRDVIAGAGYSPVQRRADAQCGGAAGKAGCGCGG